MKIDINIDKKLSTIVTSPLRSFKVVMVTTVAHVADWKYNLHLSSHQNLFLLILIVSKVEWIIVQIVSVDTRLHVSRVTYVGYFEEVS